MESAFFLFAPHIGDRAGKGVGLLDISLGNGEVGFDHVQGCVSQDFAQGVDVAAVAEEHHGEAMAEAMWVRVGDAGQGAERVDELIEGVTGEAGSLFAEEGGGISRRIIPCGEDVFHHSAPGLIAERNGAGFVALTGDGDLAVLAVKITDTQVAQFRRADAGIDQQIENSFVAQFGGTGVRGCGPAAIVGIVAAATARSDHSIEVALGEGNNVSLLWLGTRDAAHDVLGGLVIFDGPGPERGIGGMMIE